MIRGVFAAVLALSLAGCNTAYNYFEEEKDGTEEKMTAMQSLMIASGMIPSERRGIEYQPRAPLAMPGSSDLPAPEAGNSTAEAAVNFPVDEDVKRRQQRASLRAAGDAFDAKIERGDARSLPGEIDGTLAAAPRRPIDMQLAHGTTSERERLTRDEMKVTIIDPNRATIMNEEGKPAQRTSLIQPPGTYRTAAETAAVPQPKDIDNSEWVQKQLYKKNDRVPARMQGQPVATKYGRGF